MTLHYNFTYEFRDNEYDIDFDYDVDDLSECKGEFAAEKGIPLEEVDDEDDDLYDFAYEWFRDAAHDAFLEDPGVAEEVEDSYEYQKDPYSYYGVSRTWFY